MQQNSQNTHARELAGPLYDQIKNLIKIRIRADEWQDGRPLPNEMEFARQYGVSLGTIRKALEQLGNEKLIVRRQGRGTFVNEKTSAATSLHEPWQLNVDGSRETKPAHIASLSKEIDTPTAEEASALHLKRHNSVIRLITVAKWANNTASMDTFVFSLTRLSLGNGKTDINAIELLPLIEQFEPIAKRYTDKILPEIADHKLTKALGIKPEQPILKVTRLMLDHNDDPLYLLRRYIASSNAIEYSASVR